MQAIILIGIQATGKSTFYKANFFNSHVRLSMDLLNTRNKERHFLDLCFTTQSKFVIDNTNVTIEERKKYIDQARQNKYEIVGYYFSSEIEDALNRNSLRTGKERVPDVGIKGHHAKLELPRIDEGFDELFFVRASNNELTVEDWQDEI